MARKTSGDSSRGVSGIIFRGIQDSFTTQGFAPKKATEQASCLSHLGVTGRSSPA
jgi:hypothetical protein